ncbi:MAG: M23 family metallopeptidase [Candidatus Wildermuthbacteria bacterium]|nr:M23 family metallopeptidase [Candidatus Wildermuthbacteria bacterium]
MNRNTNKIIFSVALAFFVFFPLFASAANPAAVRPYDNLKLNLEYPSFGGFRLDQQTNGLSQIIGWLYYALVGLSGAAAFAMFVVGGVRWLSSSGNPSLIGDARDQMQNALLGLLLVLSSVLIIRIINPELTILKEPTLEKLVGMELSNPLPVNMAQIGSGCIVSNPQNYHITAGFHSALYALEYPKLAPHQGVDINTSAGTPILALASGVRMSEGEIKDVVDENPTLGCGNYLYIKHDGNVVTKYCHLQSSEQKENYGAGEVVGYSGASGETSGGHLHFQVWKNGKWVDPREVISCLKAMPCEEDKNRGSWCRIQSIF